MSLDRKQLTFHQLFSFLRRGIDLIYRELTAHLLAYFLPKRIMKMGKYFPLWEKQGYHVVPVHFYHPIPDTRTLSDDIWIRKSSLPGINLQSMKQIDLLRDFAKHYRDAYLKFPKNATNIPFEYYHENIYMTAIDAALLYSFIRHYKPSRVIEIGSGLSTFVSAQAVRDNRNDGYVTDLTAIEPFPSSILREGFDDLTKLYAAPLQDIPLSLFEGLGQNDILFIDSSHSLKIDSDVQRLYLNIIPQLNAGVIIHAHDIFLPYEYPKIWIMEQTHFWTEQYLLQAFLAFNKDFEVLVGVNHILQEYPDVAKEVWGEYANEFTDLKMVNQAHKPSSFWFRRVDKSIV